MLREAERVVSSAQLIEQPSLYGSIATAYAVIGSMKESARMYEVALSSAGELLNPRPRALAVTAICRQMGRERLVLTDSVRNKLNALLETFPQVSALDFFFYNAVLNGFAMAVYVPMILRLNFLYLPPSSRPKPINVVMVLIGAATYGSFAIYTLVDKALELVI